MALRTSRPNSRTSESAPAGQINAANLLMLAVLLSLPLFALYRWGPDWRLAAPYLVAIGALSYASYAADKRRAQRGEWRIPESTLHLLELLGGWPGAFLGQRRFRHKTSKPSYQIAFWLIVFGYQLAAFDSLQDWRYSKALIHYIKAKP